ncbi:glycan acetyltransferase [Sulfuricella sp. T08]|uniref:acyltransferase n=1 Tax=Sulfuricella sp. T08 TaxID=1632857 RepID=UPI000617962E|nr:DapH/DapD/GlmU-related protein [Sulfuricella sp. T08]GAO34900.1 glycan acetyltransferase [Sulfuricella sp. T08]
MRQITSSQILTFLLLLALILVLGIGTIWLLFGALPLGDFRGVVLTGAALLSVYLYAFAVYRLFLHIMPLRDGEIDEGSEQEFIYHVYILFYLILFYPIIRSGLMPTPLMRMFYLALGTRLGSNTYCQGIIHDPPFVQVGANSVIGQSALLIPHVIEGKRLAHYPIRIGDGVTIGAHAVVLPNVTIGDNAIVATGAVVTKGTRIGANEIWGGIPAKLLKRRTTGEAA